MTTAVMPTSTGARRFGWACAAGGAVSMFVLTWFATRGFAALFDRPDLGDFFDAQARALFHGHWDMSPQVLAFERFNVDGRFYTYFGPTPALLRMPLLLVTDGLDGRLSRVSMIVACAVTVWAVARLSWLARRSVRGSEPVSRGETVVAAGVVVVASLGTVVPYLAGWTAVYDEAIIWGVAFALVSYAALVAWLLDARTRDLVIAGVAAALSVLARGSVGFGPIAALGVAALLRGWSAWRERRAGGQIQWASLGVLAAVVVVPIALYGYVNRAKFGVVFGAPPFGKQDILVNDFPPRARAMAANGGSLLGIRYAPTILFRYLRPDGVELDRLFPFVLVRGSSRVLGGAVFEALHPTTSVTAASPLPFVVAMVGGVVAFVRRGLRAVWLAPVIGTVVGSVGAVALAFVDQRYQGDFIPLLVVPGVLGAWVIVDWLSGRSRALVASVVGVAVLLGAWSVWANVATAFVFQRSQVFTATVADRASLVKAQLEVQDLLGGELPSRVAAGDALPDDGTDGNLFVLGDCDGVYRHDGAVWQAVEKTRATGRVRLAVRLDPDAPGRQPLLSGVDDAGATVIWARNRADGRVGIEYQWQPRSSGGEPGRTIALGSVDPGADGAFTLGIDVGGDVLTTNLQARADDRLLFDGTTNGVGSLEVGVQRALPGATSFAGTVRTLPVPTPLCDRLVSMGLELPGT